MSQVTVNSLSVYANGIVRVIYSPVEIENLFTGAKCKSNALWDTGATGSAITKLLAESLNLPPIGKMDVKGVHGIQTRNVYAVKVILNNNNISFNLRVTECDDLTDDHSTEMLLGMDIISQGDFAISNFEGKTTMTFRQPSIQKIDFVVPADNYVSPNQQPLSRGERREYERLKKKHGHK
ncbi:MAG: retropepsin-like aspartic protease [Bacteroidia bacterium]|nr:retropepsin-like aspartic protease [Bacteroidia bacterium]